MHRYMYGKVTMEDYLVLFLKKLAYEKNFNFIYLYLKVL